MNIEIIYEDDTELADYEAFNKGYRADVIVVIGDRKYKIYIIQCLDYSRILRWNKGIQGIICLSQIHLLLKR